MTASGGINKQGHKDCVREKLYQSKAAEMNGLLLEIEGRSYGKAINCNNKGEDNERRWKYNLIVFGPEEISYSQQQGEENDPDKNKPEDMILQLFISIPYRLHLFKKIWKCNFKLLNFKFRK